MPFTSFITRYIGQIHMPNLRWSDLLEIFILTYLFYHILVWIKDTRAWSLLKGILVVVAFVAVAALLNMTTILWIVQNVTGIAVTAVVIILQPELRNAMEELGRKDFLSSIFSSNNDKKQDERFSEKTITEIVKACLAMSKVKTGALIVISQSTPLGEYERTGIHLDGVVTSQLLINIFEKNTPLHDGAVIIDGNRITAATCYLPLSDHKLDKTLGTRHRAAVGVSEETDSLTIIVSEETGDISYAYRGYLRRNVDAEALKKRLEMLLNKDKQEERHARTLFFKGHNRKENS